MTRELKLRLEPSGREIAATPGTRLADLLFEQDVEFPCGGVGACGDCRVRLVDGQLDATQHDLELLGAEQVAQGWRLACRASVEHDATLELAQWDARVLSDDARVAFTPRAGWGIAIDLGTTTIAAQLVDLSTGEVLAVRTGMNPQARYGADIMSRVHYAVHESADQLTKTIRDYLHDKTLDLLREASRLGRVAQPLSDIVIVGNTVMHHLFAGFDARPLARSPFVTPHLAEATLVPSELGWNIPADCRVRVLPNLGGFIGSDILAGVLATGMQHATQPQVLIDLGTNGEIVATDGARVLCAATAAGPAFEGARIRKGMRAARGAIDRVTCDHDQLRCHVLGGGPALGVCGSGLVDAAACALQAGLLQPSGRLTQDADRLPLAGGVYLHQCDLRELQLAKGAIAAGIDILLARLGVIPEEVTQTHLCGAFGNYLDVQNAHRLGLFPFPPSKVQAAGNTALRGAKLALLAGDVIAPDIAVLCERVEHVSLNEDPDFMDVYVRHMALPLPMNAV